MKEFFLSGFPISDLKAWSVAAVERDSHLYNIGIIRYMCLMVYVSDDVCVWWCMCLMVYVSDGVCVWWCVCLMVYVSDGVCVWWCMCLMVYVSDGVCVWWCRCLMVYVSDGGCVWWCMCLMVFVSMYMSEGPGTRCTLYHQRVLGEPRATCQIGLYICLCMGKSYWLKLSGNPGEWWLLKIYLKK